MPQDKTYWINRGKDDTKMDWDRNAHDWVHDYVNSTNHLHRDKIVEIVGKLKPESVFEIGASTGPNLSRIQEKFPNISLKGVDVSPLVVEQAIFDGFEVAEGDVLDIPYHGKADMVLCDAVLMYIEPKDIKKAMDEITRIAEKYIVFVEWDNESVTGEVVDFHWSRDYKSILEFYGFEVEKIKIDDTIWKTATWCKNGYLYVGKRKS